MANAKAAGKWVALASVASPDAFNPEVDKSAKKAFVSELTLGDGTGTGHPFILWTGDHVLNLNL